MTVSPRGDDPPRPPRHNLLDDATGVLVDGAWRPGAAKAVVRDKFTQPPAVQDMTDPRIIVLNLGASR
jgi:hypothetical protein